MNDPLLTLISRASEAILASPQAIMAETLKRVGVHHASLFEFLSRKNGWYAFESALHVFPLGVKESVLDLETWNSDVLWRNDFGELAEGCFFFAEDVFGVQFCYKCDQIYAFNPETGDKKPFARDLKEWAKLILDDLGLHTGLALAHEWQAQHRPLDPGERLFPKIPFALQGTYTVDNLYALDCVKGMKYLASIALQLRHLPDGTRVKFRVRN